MIMPHKDVPECAYLFLNVRAEEKDEQIRDAALRLRVKNASDGRDDTHEDLIVLVERFLLNHPPTWWYGLRGNKYFYLSNVGEVTKTRPDNSRRQTEEELKHAVFKVRVHVLPQHLRGLDSQPRAGVHRVLALEYVDPDDSHDHEDPLLREDKLPRGDARRFLSEPWLHLHGGCR